MARHNSIVRANNDANSISVREKKTGPEELGEGVSGLVKGIADMILNTLVLGTELVRAGASKISQVVGSKDPEIVTSRKKITKHHLKQSKKAIKNFGTGTWNTIKGGYHTTKGTIRTAVFSGKETMKGVRNVDNGEENESNNRAA